MQNAFIYVIFDLNPFYFFVRETTRATKKKNATTFRLDQVGNWFRMQFESGTITIIHTVNWGVVIAKEKKNYRQKEKRIKKT